MIDSPPYTKNRDSNRVYATVTEISQTSKSEQKTYTVLLLINGLSNCKKKKRIAVSHNNKFGFQKSYQRPSTGSLVPLMRHLSGYDVSIMVHMTESQPRMLLGHVT